MKTAFNITIHVLAVVAGIFFGQKAFSAETNVLLYAHSKHFNSSEDKFQYNEKHPTLGAEYFPDNSVIGYTGVVYKDSYRTTAKYLAAIFTKKSGSFRYGGMIGAVHSPSYDYKGDYGRVIPFVLPYLSVNGDKFGINLLFTPKVFSDDAYVVAIQYKMGLDL